MPQQALNKEIYIWKNGLLEKTLQHGKNKIRKTCKQNCLTQEPFFGLEVSLNIFILHWGTFVIMIIFEEIAAWKIYVQFMATFKKSVNCRYNNLGQQFSNLSGMLPNVLITKPTCSQTHTSILMIILSLLGIQKLLVSHW